MYDGSRGRKSGISRLESRSDFRFSNEDHPQQSVEDRPSGESDQAGVNGGKSGGDYNKSRHPGLFNFGGLSVGYAEEGRD